MRKCIKQKLVVFLLLVTLMACSENPTGDPSNMEERFVDTVPITDMNKSLELKVYGEETNFGLGSDIPLLIYNKSPHRLRLGEMSRVRLFIARDAEWIEIENEVSYAGSTLVLPQGTPLLDLTNTWVKPAFDEGLIESGAKNVLLRIVIIAEIIENDVGTGKSVGAYVDVHIDP